LTSLFMPEREWVRRRVMEPLLHDWDHQQAVAEQGYRGESSHHEYSPQHLAEELVGLNRVWFDRPKYDGVRWRLFVDGVQRLRELGAQLVILDPPAHPDFVDGIAGSPMGKTNDRFHAQLAEFCKRNGVPLVRFTAEGLDAADPTSSFVSLMHLNRTGANRLSGLVADELVALIDAGTLRVPLADH